MRNFFRTEADKLKKMNFTDKRQYIWEYYKLHLLFIAVLLFFIGYMINIWFINPPKRDYLYIAWQAHMVAHDQLGALGDRLSVIVENPERYHVRVQSYALTGEPQMDQALITRFFAMMQVGELHAIITTGDEMLANAYGGLIKPIYPVMDALAEINPGLHDYISERLITLTFTPEVSARDGEAETVTEVMSIDLNGVPLLDELGFWSEDLYFGLVISSDYYYQLAKALVVLFE